MSRRTNLLLVLVAFTLALVTTLVVMRRFSTRAVAKPTVQAVAVKVDVVETTRAIKAHTVIHTPDLRVTSMNSDSVPPGAYTSTKQVIGHYSAGSIDQGAVLTPDLVVDNAAEAAFPLSIPVGLRAFTIADDPLLGVDHLISGGDRVDVISLMTDSKGHAVVKTIAQDVLVLTVDHPPSTTLPTPPPANGKPTLTNPLGAQQIPYPGSQDTVTLAVTPQQAEWLELVDSKGTVRLTLRNPSDTSKPSLPKVTDQKY